MTDPTKRLGSPVRIVPLDRPGRVIAIYIADTGVQYQVRYFDNCDAKTVYFFAEELAFE